MKTKRIIMIIIMTITIKMIKNLSLDTNADIFFLQKYRLCVDLAVEVIKDLILFSSFKSHEARLLLSSE